MTTESITIPSSLLSGMLNRADQYRLNLSALRALCAIHAAGADALTMTTIAKAIDLSTAAVTHIADHLVSLGYVTRRPARVDGRVIWLELTARGKDALTDILTIA